MEGAQTKEVAPPPLQGHILSHHILNGVSGHHIIQKRRWKRHETSSFPLDKFMYGFQRPAPSVTRSNSSRKVSATWLTRSKGGFQLLALQQRQERNVLLRLQQLQE